jgi:hypothetical protein
MGLLSVNNWIFDDPFPKKVVEAVEIIEAAEVLRSNTDDFRVIQVLEFSFTLMF